MLDIGLIQSIDAMDEIVSSMISNTISSFDFTYCILVNILTYLGIKGCTEIFGKKFTTWGKRGVFISAAIIVAIVYICVGCDTKTLVNSIILAPVSWSWIFKPIVKKLKIDYSDF